MTVDTFGEPNNFLRVTRVVGFSSNLILVVWSLVHNTLARMLCFYTNWELIFTFLYFTLAVWLQNTPRSWRLRNPVSQRMHYLLQQRTLLANSLILVIYWNLLFRAHMREFQGNSER